MSLLGIYLIAGQNSRRLGMSRRRDAVVDVVVLNRPGFPGDSNS